jgi:hypothetical protein
MINDMQTNTLKLPESFINLLINLPENGMGYQIVNVFLKGGKVLHRQKVLNSEFLIMEENEKIAIRDIEKIELEVK